MHADPQPINNTIVALLKRILEEVETLKGGQRAMADDIRRIANTAGR